MKRIELINSKHPGNYAIVDDEDYEWLSKTKWYFWKDKYSGYAVNCKGKKMHRIIINAPKGVQVDHINRNKLDNRKSNLRLCTIQENIMNRTAQKNSKSGLKGVKIRTIRLKNQTTKYIEVSIRKNKKDIYIGRFKTLKDASNAYDRKAKELFGEFAYLNKFVDVSKENNSQKETENKKMDFEFRQKTNNFVAQIWNNKSMTITIKYKNGTEKTFIGTEKEIEYLIRELRNNKHLYISYIIRKEA